MEPNPFEDPEVVLEAIALLRLADKHASQLNRLRNSRHSLRRFDAPLDPDEQSRLDDAIEVAVRVNYKIMAAFWKLAGEEGKL